MPVASVRLGSLEKRHQGDWAAGRVDRGGIGGDVSVTFRSVDAGGMLITHTMAGIFLWLFTLFFLIHNAAISAAADQGMKRVNSLWYPPG